LIEVAQCGERRRVGRVHRDGGERATPLARPAASGWVHDELLEESRLELSHVRRLLDDLTSSCFTGEFDSSSQRRYEALCRLERELLGLQA
jgi:hypothetical protein